MCVWLNINSTIINTYCARDCFTRRRKIPYHTMCHDKIVGGLQSNDYVANGYVIYYTPIRRVTIMFLDQIRTSKFRFGGLWGRVKLKINNIGTSLIYYLIYSISHRPRCSTENSELHVQHFTRSLLWWHCFRNLYFSFRLSVKKHLRLSISRRRSTVNQQNYNTNISSTIQPQEKPLLHT